MLTLERQEQRGFSLIELLMVVAIIGILAAIAVPQFAAYRQRAFNAAALSDLINLQKTEGGMATDWQEFGLTTNGGGSVAAHGNGLILQGPGSSQFGVAGTRSFLQISLSSNVGIVANTDTASGRSFTALSKHVQGVRIYGADSDVTGAYFQSSSGGVSLAGTGVVVPSTPLVSDFGSWSLL